MKILSIGNSFSVDAHRYLNPLFRENGIPVKNVNLNIGGCSLRTHYLNMLDNLAAYSFDYKGESVGLKVTIAEVLASDEWDIVTLQQASHFSAQYETYTPYVEELAAYIRRYCPHTRLMLHETWAYEEGSERLLTVANFEKAADMHAAVRDAYARAAESIRADGIIPCGDAMIKAAEMGAKVHRDTFHASLGVGRYLLALTWLRTLTGCDITENAFSAFAAPVSEEERRIAIAAVNEATAK